MPDPGKTEADPRSGKPKDKLPACGYGHVGDFLGYRHDPDEDAIPNRTDRRLETIPEASLARFLEIHGIGRYVRPTSEAPARLPDLEFLQSGRRPHGRLPLPTSAMAQLMLPPSNRKEFDHHAPTGHGAGFLPGIPAQAHLQGPPA